MDKMNNLKDLLKHEIQDLVSVEEQIIEALPVMIDKASNISLKNALTEHLRVTEEHKNRLDKIQKSFNEKQEERKGLFASLFGGGKQVCKGMEGIISEGNKMMNEPMDPSVLDAVIIACAQKVEHYEICGYGTARTYARELKLNKVVVLLEETLNEEYQADELLTLLAENGLNQQAETKVQGRPVNTSLNERSTSESGRSKKQERHMEPVSDTNRSTGKSSGSRSKGGSPKSTEAPRNSGGRSTSTKQKSQSSGSSSQSKSGRGSQNSSGRGSNGKTGRSR
jgi:ferritin-like metal-binding protein YciE